MFYPNVQWIDGLMHMYIHSLFAWTESFRWFCSLEVGDGASEMLRFAIKVFRLEIEGMRLWMVRWSKTDPKLAGRIHHISEGMPPSMPEEVWTNSVSLGLWQDKINKIDHCHNTCCQACLVRSCIVYGINSAAKWKSSLRHLQIHLGGWSAFEASSRKGFDVSAAAPIQTRTLIDRCVKGPEDMRKR